jgi:hypothetical protein
MAEEAEAAAEVGKALASIAEARIEPAPTSTPVEAAP